jgi:hypothetical protein
MRKQLWITVVGGLLMAGLVAVPASADPQSTPNGPWPTDEQRISLSALRSYEQLWKTLEQIQAAGQGAMALSAAPGPATRAVGLPRSDGQG